MIGKFNINNIMQGAQEMQEKLGKIEVTGSAGADAITITMTARHYVKSCHISDELLNESKEVLEELIAAAINDASKKIEDQAQSQMMDVNSLMGSLMGGKSDNTDKED